MIQIYVKYVINVPEANAALREFQKTFPRRKILSVSMAPYTPEGWFMTATYEIDA